MFCYSNISTRSSWSFICAILTVSGFSTSERWHSLIRQLFDGIGYSDSSSGKKSRSASGRLAYGKVFRNKYSFLTS